MEDQPIKEVRVRVEAPPPEAMSLDIQGPAGELGKIYYALMVSTIVLSGISLFLSFKA